MTYFLFSPFLVVRCITSKASGKKQTEQKYLLMPRSYIDKAKYFADRKFSLRYFSLCYEINCFFQFIVIFTFDVCFDNL